MFKRLLLNMLAFYVVAYIIPGVEISGWKALLVIAIVWGIVASILKPILTFLTLPINILTLGLFTFVLNGLLLMLAAKLVNGFEIKNFLVAILAAITLSLVNAFFSKLK